MGHDRSANPDPDPVALYAGPVETAAGYRQRVALFVCVLLLAGLIAQPSPSVAAEASSTSAQAAVDDPCTSTAGWALSTTTFDTAFYRHAVVGNGYLGQRVPPTGTGYFTTGEPTGWPLYTPRYDGAFVAGLYARDPGLAGGRKAIAAIPTWSTLTVGAGGETYRATTPASQISNYNQTLFLRCGVLRTSLTWTTSDGKATDLVYDVIADRVNKHVGAVRLRMTPRWNGRAAVTDVIDGAGARRVVHAGAGDRGGSTVGVEFTTLTTGTAGAVASTLRHSGVDSGSVRRSTATADLTASQMLDFPVRSGRSYEFVKFVGVDTALTSADPRGAAVTASQSAAQQGWSALLSGHVSKWADLWQSDIEVPDQPDLQAWLRSGLYGLLSNIREGEDDSISPVGLTSDNYAGLIFWDAETWMFPGLLALHPDIAKSVLEYRYRTLPGALANARTLGYAEGASFYPWNGADTGDLATECHSVDPPHCVTQIHLQGDIALAVWQYYLATGDTEWLRTRGWPMLDGIARFWAGRVTDNGDGTYSITNVAGPDEYSNGVTDGVYTNAVAALSLRNATRAAQILGQQAPAQWTTIADNLRMPFDEQRQVFMQYDGYDGSLIKQADTVLLLYPVEWPMSQEVAANTLDFYAERTDPDGPAMTDSVHAVDAAAIGEPGCATNTYLNRSIKPFVRDPFAQFAEARGDKPGAQDPLAGSPAFNFLTGEGGFVQVFTNGLTGFRWRADRLRLDPLLPPQLGRGVTLRDLNWRGRTFDITVGPDVTTVTQTAGPPSDVESPQGIQVVSTGSPLTLKTRRPDLAPTDNVARCRPAQASSEEPGMYGEAAVDGSDATVWAPADPSGSVRVDLGRRTGISRITVQWTDVLPQTYQILVSSNGSDWTAAPPASADGTLQHTVNARYVRVDLTFPPDVEGAGIKELQVIRK